MNLALVVVRDVLISAACVAAFISFLLWVAQ